MKPLSTTFRLSVSVTMLTLSILFAAELFDLLPSRSAEVMKTRTLITESLAVQISALASRDDRATIDHLLEQFVTRGDGVLAAAFKDSAGRPLASFGDYAEVSENPSSSYRDATRIEVPISRQKRLWGTVEVRFVPLWGDGLLGALAGTSVSLFAFVALTGFAAYYLFLRRGLSELNPSRVVPDRVRAAFDVLTEGVLILDGSGRIVLANAAIAERLGYEPTKLVGMEAAKLPFVARTGDDLLPWIGALESGDKQRGVFMELTSKRGHTYTFAVNAAPIMDAQNQPRGALATFDDLSQVERHNHQLNKALDQLEHSKLQISEKNRELELLAMRDSLTGCFNRRYLFQHLDRLFSDRGIDRRSITCYMVDIDHFKQVNDRYGHAMGDEVIKNVGEVLMANSRAEDVVGRYGGEEFCVVGRGLSHEQEIEFAERLRRAIAAIGGSENARFPLLRITASVGFATGNTAHEKPMDLVEQADEALYRSKEGGRNRVTRYVPEDDAERPEPSAQVVWLNSAQPVEGSPKSSKDTLPAPRESEQIVALKDRVRELEELALKRADEIWHKSLFDNLTQLPNRILLLDRAEQDIKRIPRYGKILAAVSVEIETVHRVNDSLGHAAADHLLKEIASRLGDIVRYSDTLGIMSSPNSSTLARIGNSEFVILLGGIFSHEAVSQVLGRAMEVISEPFNVNDEEIYVSGNFGVGLYPNDADSAEALIKAANAARKHAQQKGERLNSAFYSEEMNQAATRRIRIEGLLHQALKLEQFTVFYQPKVNVETGCYHGVEALIRWQKTPLGEIPPSEFIPIAEEIGLIPELSTYVLRSVCRQLKSWEPLGLEDLSVAVNLSAIEFRDPDVAKRILAVLAEESVPPGWLQVEVTESAFIDSMSTAVTALKQLEEAGVELAIDDFGTGYSSLSHLSLLPLHVLKVDGSFIRDIDVNPGSQAIVRAILAMARTAGLRVVAEGVETSSEAAWLKREGCDEAQGYLFSRPVSGPTMTSLLIDNNERVIGKSEDRGDSLWRRLIGRRIA